MFFFIHRKIYFSKISTQNAFIRLVVRCSAFGHRKLLHNPTYESLITYFAWGTFLKSNISLNLKYLYNKFRRINSNWFDFECEITYLIRFDIRISFRYICENIEPLYFALQSEMSIPPKHGFMLGKKVTRFLSLLTTLVLLVTKIRCRIFPHCFFCH